MLAFEKVRARILEYLLRAVEACPVKDSQKQGPLRVTHPVQSFVELGCGFQIERQNVQSSRALCIFVAERRPPVLLSLGLAGGR